MDSGIHPFGLPCSEGGSVAIENVAAVINNKREVMHCIIFYLPEHTDSRPLRGTELTSLIRLRELNVASVVSECINHDESCEGPIDLARKASCIMYRASLSDNSFPCYGVAVMPKRAHSAFHSADTWARAKFSAFRAAHGYVYHKIVPVKIFIEGICYGTMELSVLVHSPLDHM